MVVAVRRASYQYQKIGTNKREQRGDIEEIEREEEKKGGFFVLLSVVHRSNLETSIGCPPRATGLVGTDGRSLVFRQQEKTAPVVFRNAMNCTSFEPLMS